MLDEPTFMQSAEATAFVAQISTNVGRKVTLGDPDKYQPNPFNYVSLAHNAIEDGLKKVRALGSDKTRTLVQKHDAARAVANQVCEKLDQSRAGIESSIDSLNETIETTLMKKFDIDRLSDRMKDRIANWIERTYREEDGAAKIRSKVETDLDVATVLFFDKTFLLGMSDDFHNRMIAAARAAHAPEVQASMDRATELRKWADNYPQVQRSVRASWFNNALADQAASRVEI